MEKKGFAALEKPRVFVTIFVVCGRDRARMTSAKSHKVGHTNKMFSLSRSRGHQPILLVEKAPIFTDLITKMNDYWPGDSPNMDIFVRCVHQFPSLAVNDMNCPLYECIRYQGRWSKVRAGGWLDFQKDTYAHEIN